MRRWIWAAIGVLGLLLSTCCASTRDPAEQVGILSVRLTSLAEETPGSDTCQLGALTTTSALQAAQADVAILPAADLENDLPVGAVSWGDLIQAVNEDRELALVVITPAQLYEMLEYGLSYLVLDTEQEKLLRDASHFDGFPQIAGFTLTADASAAPGERVYQVRLNDGTELLPNDTQTQLRLVSTTYLLSGGYGYQALDGWQGLGLTLADSLAAYLGETDRTEFTKAPLSVIGARETTLAGQFPTPVLLGVLAFLAALFLLFRLKYCRVKWEFMPISHGTYGRYP